MSAESQAIFEQAWRDYPRTRNVQALVVAAQGHIGASRPWPELAAAYAEALADQEYHTPERAAAAQAIADELEPVRTAYRIIEGHLPAMEEAPRGMD